MSDCRRIRSTELPISRFWPSSAAAEEDEPAVEPSHCRCCQLLPRPSADPALVGVSIGQG